MPYSSKAQSLKRSPIFSSLKDNELDELASLATERNFTSNEFIFRDGDAPEWFYIITDGKVKVIKHSSSGREFILSFFGVGEIFGAVAIFEDKPYPASAQALCETKVVGIKRVDFLSFLAKQPQIALRVINILGARLRDAQTRLRDLASERVEQRLARTLLMLSSKFGASLPFTRQEIAEMTGTTTETAIRITSQLRARKIIHSVRNKITILDKEKLRLLSDGPPRV